jgi:hypothetical protein
MLHHQEVRTHYSFFCSLLQAHTIYTNVAALGVVSTPLDDAVTFEARLTDAQAQVLLAPPSQVSFSLLQHLEQEFQRVKGKCVHAEVKRVHDLVLSTSSLLESNKTNVLKKQKELESRQQAKSNSPSLKQLGNLSPPHQVALQIALRTILLLIDSRDPQLLDDILTMINGIVEGRLVELLSFTMAPDLKAAIAQLTSFLRKHEACLASARSLLLGMALAGGHVGEVLAEVKAMWMQEEADYYVMGYLAQLDERNLQGSEAVEAKAPDTDWTPQLVLSRWSGSLPRHTPVSGRIGACLVLAHLSRLSGRFRWCLMNYHIMLLLRPLLPPPLTCCNNQGLQQSCQHHTSVFSTGNRRKQIHTDNRTGAAWRARTSW